MAQFVRSKDTATSILSSDPEMVLYKCCQLTVRTYRTSAIIHFTFPFSYRTATVSRAPHGVAVRLNSERSVMFPLNGTPFSLYGYRIDSSREYVFAILAPGRPSNKPVININGFHCAAGQSHEFLLLKTVE